MEHLVDKRNLWFTISIVVILPGLISLILFGLKLGIDFTGGSLWEVRFAQPIAADHLTMAARRVELRLDQR